MASWSSNPTCHYLKAIYRAPFWGSPGWVECSRLQGWGWSIFQKTIGWCKQTGVASASFASFWRDPLMRIYISSMEYIQCQSSLKCASTGLNDAVHRWRPMVTGMVVTQQRCCDQSPCHPATMVGILEKIHPLPWRYVSTRRASFVIKARQKGTIALTVIHVQLSKGLSEEF